jgi:methionine synthase I (cobalamin-dependent)
MRPLLKSLLQSGPVVTDGSWGTQMQQRGLKRGECPDSWNLSQPEKVLEVARCYVDAGSRIILTNTFQSSRISLERYGLADQTEAINREGVRISKRAAGDRALVFASIGPSGKMLVTGETSEGELRSVFEEQAAAQAGAGADGIVVETMIDIAEACIAAEAALQTGLAVIASMVFDSGENRDMTMMGNSPEEVVEALAGLAVDGIGANCGQGIEAFPPICSRMRQKTDLPLWMKPNAGLPDMVDDRAVFKTRPEEFVGFVPRLIEAGANFIGGCCGTDQNFIRAIRELLDRA